MQHFLLLRTAPLYLAAVLIEQWSRLNNALRKSEDRFRTIADLAPMMMWTSGIDGGRVRQPGLAGIHRENAEESLGKGWSESLHPDDLQRTMDYFREFQ